jgi:hypothetical protein
MDDIEFSCLGKWNAHHNEAIFVSRVYDILIVHIIGSV